MKMLKNFFLVLHSYIGRTIVSLTPTVNTVYDAHIYRSGCHKASITGPLYLLR